MAASARSKIKPLGVKQRTPEHLWTRTWAHIQAAPDYSRAERLLDAAADRLRRRLHFTDPQKVGWCWSAGKDSIALELVLERVPELVGAGGVSAWTELEVPSFIEWAIPHAPANVQMVVQEHINLDWLIAKGEDWLFPKTKASRWFAPVQHKVQSDFIQEHGLEVLLTGGRKADGNHLGRGPNPLEYPTKHGAVKFLPIGDWSHEDVFHVLAASGRELPPIYEPWFPRRFTEGTGPWPGRARLSTVTKSWHEIRRIDSSIITSAAEGGLESAQRYLEQYPLID